MTMSDLQWRYPVGCCLAVLLCACGGGGGGSGSEAGGGSISSTGTAACERVSQGSSTLVVTNRLAGGVEVVLPQFAFGANMFSGECVMMGLEFPQAALTVRVEMQQCANTFEDSDCRGRLFGPTRTTSVVITRGATVSLDVTAAAFN